jgi:pSer/pThr/pTyr-binding forkhead associated (FHA) protein
MALTIVVRSGDVAAPPSISFDSPRLVIGRGEGCDLRLPDPSISHRHASIRQRGSEYLIVDEGSTNGTFVGPVRLSPQAPRVIRTGDLVRVGRIWLAVTIEPVVPTQNANLATKEIALALVAAALEAQGDAAAVRVYVREGPDSGRELLLTEIGRPYVIGRGGRVDLSVDDPDASRRHVELTRRGSSVMVRDLGSKNRSALGDRPLEPDRPERWPGGEDLVVGANRLGYEDPLSLALDELEHAADEQMRDDESVDPPDAADAAEPDAAEPSESPPLAERRAAPIAALPKKAGRRDGTRRGIDPTDLLVAVLALAVLGLSVLGLVWLLGSE